MPRATNLVDNGIFLPSNDYPALFSVFSLTLTIATFTSDTDLNCRSWSKDNDFRFDPSYI